MCVCVFCVCVCACLPAYGGVSSVLKSPDGNWIALQSAQLSRPSLLTKRKSLVYSALERESGVVSAYEGMGSDNENKPEPDSPWGAALQEIHRKMTDSNFNLQDTGDKTPSPVMSRRGSTDYLFSDSEGNWHPNKHLMALFKKKFPAEIRRPSSSRRTNIIDVNFNVEGAGEEEEEEEESEVAAEMEAGKVRRSRKKKKNKKESAASSSSALCHSKNDNHSQNTSDALTPDTLTSGATTPEPFALERDITGHGGNQMDQELTSKLQQLADQVSDSFTGEASGLRDAGNDGPMEEERQDSEDRGEEDERVWRMEVDLEGGKTEDEEEEKEADDEMRYRLQRLVAQSRLTYFSSTDDDLDKVGQSEEEWDRDKDEGTKEEKTDRLTYKLCQLEKEVRAYQFSSTEDELDRAGIMDEEKQTEEEEDGKNEELALKVCRLENQVNATQFSSTEDELDRVGRGEEATDEETLWKLQAEKAIQAAQLRDLASLVSGSQRSAAEDQLGRFGENEGEIDQDINVGGIGRSMWEEAVGKKRERRESFGDLDVKMFALRDEIEERKTETAENISDQTQVERKGCTEEREAQETGDESTGKGQTCEEKTEKETELKTVLESVRTEEIIVLHETKVQQENQPEAKWPDNEEREERNIRESKEGQGKWGTAADSDEEDAEFDRIISSMLMMTLEDMQGGTSKDEDAENGRINKEAGKTGSVKDMKDRSGDKLTEHSGGEISRKKEDTHKHVEKDVDEKKRNLTKQKPTVLTISETVETNEAEHIYKTAEVEDEEDRGGRVTTACQMMEARGDTAEGGCKETDERLSETKVKDVTEQDTFSFQEGLLSPEEIQMRYSAVSLRSLTTEVLKVLNATEELLQGMEEGGGGGGDNPQLSTASLPPNTDAKKLDQQFSRLEENVYVAAGTVYSLEAELSDLEECARGICSATSDMELSFLEEQVASAAAKVQQSELRICDISARIAALKSAGLNVDTQSRLAKTRTVPVMPVTLDSSRQLRRRLPAPPVKEDKET